MHCVGDTCGNKNEKTNMFQNYSFGLKLYPSVNINYRYY